jgi:NADH-quinone oxidoreductase subunit J
MISQIILFIITFLIIFSSVMVITSSNSIYSMLFLILVFCNVSLLLFMLEVEFIAVILLIIYIGAIAVLFLFIIMMIDIKLVKFKTTFLKYYPIIGLIGLIFFYQFYLLSYLLS